MSESALRLASPEETLALGRRLGALLREGDFVALRGELGAGKTLLVRGVAEGVGHPPSLVSSPTFALLNVYGGQPLTLRHFDLYRLRGPADLYALGFEELLEEPGASLCEWPERAESLLPEGRLEITLWHDGATSRLASLRGLGERGRKLAQELVAEADG